MLTGIWYRDEQVRANPPLRWSRGYQRKTVLLSRGHQDANSKNLNRQEFLAKIEEIISAWDQNFYRLLAFAEFISEKPFAEPVLSVTELKMPVCKVFVCNNATELRNLVNSSLRLLA